MKQKLYQTLLGMGLNREVVCIRMGEVLKLCDLSNGSKLDKVDLTSSGGGGVNNGLVYSKDGSYLAASSGEKNGNVVLFRVSKRRRIRPSCIHWQC